MKIPFISNRRQYKHFLEMEKLELARHKRMMELISIASKNGMSDKSKSL